MLALKLAEEVLSADQVVVENPPCRTEEIGDKRIAYGIPHADALLAAGHDVGRAQHGKLLRDHGLVDAEGFLQLLDALLPFDEQLEDPDPNGVRQSPEEPSLERLKFVSGDFIHIFNSTHEGPPTRRAGTRGRIAHTDGAGEDRVDLDEACSTPLTRGPCSTRLTARAPRAIVMSSARALAVYQVCRAPEAVDAMCPFGSGEVVPLQ